MIASHIVRRQLEEAARGFGFTKFGIAPSLDAPGFEHLRTWLERGYAGTMGYISARLEAYRNPAGVMPTCKSVILLAMPYPANSDTLPSKSTLPQSNIACASEQIDAPEQCARIASYASGRVDYHDIIHDRLKQLCSLYRSMYPDHNVRGTVDTAPLLERDFARLSGLGWIGKNTLLLSRDAGSYFFLAALLVDIELPVDDPFDNDHCGSCRACLDACPTDAFVEPRVLDATKCISYLTIENRGSIPDSLKPGIGDWLFGCDECQIVCPWNRKPRPEVLSELRPHDLDQRLDCHHWLTLDESKFRALYRHTPFWRTRLSGMQRNALIVAANTKRIDLIDTVLSFTEHENEMLRETAIWALSRLRPIR